MLAKRIIPCLDVTGGRVVKGVKYIDHVDAGDPVEQAANYDRQGADELVFLDITASLDHREIMLDIVRRVAEQVFIPFTVGGGVRSVEDIREILKAGADKTSIMTAAIKDPDLVNRGAERFGSQCIVVAIDAQRVPREGRDDSNLGYAPDEDIEWVVYTHGGHEATTVDALAWATEAEQRGAGEFLVTSMDADGTKAGYCDDEGRGGRGQHSGHRFRGMRFPQAHTGRAEGDSGRGRSGRLHIPLRSVDRQGRKDVSQAERS